jgi:hypothetical protein
MTTLKFALISGRAGIPPLVGSQTARYLDPGQFSPGFPGAKKRAAEPGAPITRFERERVSLPPEAPAYGPSCSGPIQGTSSFFVIFFLSVFFSFVKHFKSEVLENRTFFKIIF